MGDADAACDWIESELGSAHVGHVNRKLRFTSQGVYERIAFGNHSSGCVAEFSAPDCSVDKLTQDLEPCDSHVFFLVIDGVEKPGNVGAIFRTADAAGVNAVLLSDCRTDAFNPNAIRGSLGAVFTVPFAVGSQEEIKGFLSSRVQHVYSMRVEASQLLWQTELCERVAVVIGSEAQGLGERWKQWDCDGVTRDVAGITIPMAGVLDSLNASVAAALVSFEAARQRVAHDQTES